jgi:uncharacterized protein
MFEWDDRKRRANIAKHVVDFERAKRIFDGPTVEGPDVRRDYGEQRFGVYGEVDGDVLFVIYTWRGDKRRLISARKASSYEGETYRAAIDALGDEG